jgi:hypothetical protein
MKVIITHLYLKLCYSLCVISSDVSSISHCRRSYINTNLLATKQNEIKDNSHRCLTQTAERLQNVGAR